MVRPSLVLVHIPCMKVTRTHSQGSLTDADTSLCMCRQEVELGRSTRPGQEGRSRGDERVPMVRVGGLLWDQRGGHRGGAEGDTVGDTEGGPERGDTVNVKMGRGSS